MAVAKDSWQKRDAFAALMEKGDYQGYITTEEHHHGIPRIRRIGKSVGEA